MSESQRGRRLTLVCEIACPLETELAESAPTLRELVDLLEKKHGIGPYRRYVFERVDGELVFRQPEIDAIVDDAIDEAFGIQPAGRRIIKLP